MKVILIQDVKGLGKKDSLVNVNDGYARNYLLPRKLALEATSKNLNIMKQKQDAEKSKKAKEIAHAKEQAAELSKICVNLKAKVGENGKLFGSITNKEIAEKLSTDHKVDIDRKKIVLGEPIRSTGTFEVEVKLYPEITGKITVKVEQL